MTEYEIHYAGTLRVPHFGQSAASRSARRRGRIEEAEFLEKRALERHNAILAKGFIYSAGCGRFSTQICTCTKCRKK